MTSKIFSHTLIAILSEKPTLVFSCFREERGRPLDEVRSVEPVLSHFLIRLLYNFFFLLLTEIFYASLSNHLNFFEPKHFTGICFLLLKTPCSLINDEIYDVNDLSLIFRNKVQMPTINFMDWIIE